MGDPGGVGRYGKAYGMVRGVARRQVLVQLDDALVDSLDTRAQAAGISRSELIRRAIANHLRDLAWTAHDEVAAASYRGSPESWTGRGWPEE